MKCMKPGCLTTIVVLTLAIGVKCLLDVLDTIRFRRRFRDPNLERHFIGKWIAYSADYDIKKFNRLDYVGMDVHSDGICFVKGYVGEGMDFVENNPFKTNEKSYIWHAGVFSNSFETYFTLSEESGKMVASKTWGWDNDDDLFMFWGEEKEGRNCSVFLFKEKANVPIEAKRPCGTP